MGPDEGGKEDESGHHHKEEEGGFLAIPVHLVEGGLKLDGALGGVKGCSHLGDRAPAEANEMSFLSLPKRTSAGRPESRSCLAKRKYTVAVEAPWPPVVSSAKGEKLDPVAAQVAG